MYEAALSSEPAVRLFCHWTRHENICSRYFEARTSEITL